MKNKKLDVNIKLSNRDKMILWVVASVAVILVAYFFGYTKIMEQVNVYQAKLNTAQSRYRELYAKNQNKEQYENDTAMYKSRFNSILMGYENGASQDNSLMFLRDIEKTTGGWIKSTTFSTTSPIHTFGSISSTNPNKAGTKAYNSDMVGYKTTLTLSYEAQYNDFKELITYINNYYSKNTIDSISMAYGDDDTVSGTMTVSTYCITGSNRAFTTPKIDLPTGTKNIFFSSTFFPTIIQKNDTNGSYILSDYDYYLLLNAPSSDMSACIMGQKGDRTGDSVLSSNENTLQKVVVKVWGSDGNYRIMYRLGSKSCPAINPGNGLAFAAGDTIDLLIMSSARKTTSDKSGVDISIINDTDKDLNVKIVDDDVTLPRVNITESTGIVNVYK